MKALLPLWMNEDDEGTSSSTEDPDDDSGMSFVILDTLSREDQKTFWQKLNSEGRQRCDRRIPRDALLKPKHSPWQKLYLSVNDQALITVTGFDHASFSQAAVGNVRPAL